MAASATPRTADRPAALAVAASGGRDSTALLHCTARLAAGHGLRVVALHVHHGLHPDADAWAAQLQRQVQRWARGGLPVTLLVRRLNGAPERGQSIEAWARRERYAALAALAREVGCDTVLLAHHRRDQAETLLLQALRGGGPAALAAMPRTAQRDGVQWLRPWLEQPREAIEAYLRRHRLGFVDDGSNVDTRFARNRLRAELWPALTAAFDDAETTLAAAALRAHEAAAALRELAALDLAPLVDREGRLAVDGWRALSPARRAVALRAWLDGRLSAGVPETLVQRLLAELPRARVARWPAGPGELRCHDGQLACVTVTRAATRSTGTAQPPATLTMDLSRPGRYPVAAWQGSLVVQTGAGEGVAPLRLREVELRPRRGGERFVLAPGGVARSLKKQYQARRVAAWDRGGPLLYAAGELLFAPGLGLDARRWQIGHGPQLRVSWVPDTPR